MWVKKRETSDERRTREFLEEENRIWRDVLDYKYSNLIHSTTLKSLEKYEKLTGEKIERK